MGHGDIMRSIRSLLSDPELYRIGTMSDNNEKWYGYPFPEETVCSKVEFKRLIVIKLH